MSAVQFTAGLQSGSEARRLNALWEARSSPNGFRLCIDAAAERLDDRIRIGRPACAHHPASLGQSA